MLFVDVGKEEEADGSSRLKRQRGISQEKKNVQWTGENKSCDQLDMATDQGSERRRLLQVRSVVSGRDQHLVGQRSHEFTDRTFRIVGLFDCTTFGSAFEYQ